MISEFDIIRRYFSRPAPSAVLGVGDDCALVRVPAGMELAVTADMLVAGRHFSPNDGPGTLGHKALAVNLSDLAAMGARPRWALLAIALPEADERWLSGFAGGFYGLAGKSGVDLIGGDTTRGPVITISVTLIGEIPEDRAIRRSGASPGDEIWVSGQIGSAAAALAYRQGTLELEHPEAAAVLPALVVPQPRVELGQALRDVASAAIDISDGLLADLGHILDASGVGARLEFERLPLAEPVARRKVEALVQQCVLAGGDDYELCFTAPADRHDAVLVAGARAGVRVTHIGEITAQPGLDVVGGDGQLMKTAHRGFDHFA
jgi:thiamine-monophosphate kinase